MGKIAEQFGVNLAELLSNKIAKIYPQFKKSDYIKNIASQVDGLNYSSRVVLHAKELNKALEFDYKTQIKILTSILGDENKSQTGMFKHYYWILPIGKFVELYGLDELETSTKAIEEITKRSTGEFAVREFIQRYPQEMLQTMKIWAKSENFHLRRLASEGLRPKLPWAKKLEIFITNPTPVFEILEILKEDIVKFVQRSVANNINDYLKVNFTATKELLDRWQSSQNKNTKWIVKHATRRLKTGA